MSVEVVLMHSDALVPTRAHATDAGMDIYTFYDMWVGRNSDTTVNTGIKVKIPAGYAGIIKEKSGRAVRDKITIGACVIDSDYRGELIIHLFNNSENTVHLKAGTAVAQMVIVPVLCADIRVVDSLDDTERGEGRMGSTGLQHPGSA